MQGHTIASWAADLLPLYILELLTFYNGLVGSKLQLFTFKMASLFLNYLGLTRHAKYEATFDFWNLRLGNVKTYSSRTSLSLSGTSQAEQGIHSLTSTALHFGMETTAHMQCQKLNFSPFFLDRMTLLKLGARLWHLSHLSILDLRTALDAQVPSEFTALGTTMHTSSSTVKRWTPSWRAARDDTSGYFGWTVGL